MRTAEECRAKAQELSDLAGSCSASNARDALFLMARTWEQLAVQADWQDACPLSKTHRIQ